MVAPLKAAHCAEHGPALQPVSSHDFPPGAWCDAEGDHTERQGPLDGSSRSDWLAAIDGTHRVHWPILWPMAALLMFTLVFRWIPLDLAISGCFYDAHVHCWPWYNSWVCKWFYRAGMYPAWGLGIAGCVWMCWALLRDRRWRAVQPGLFLLLVLIAGPGLIVNQFFKANWGRPRPHQVVEFHGEHAFVPVGSPGDMEQHNSSFPSGHAAVAFYLMTPAFLVSRKRRFLARGLMALGLLYGVWMGGIRIVQGGHFVSDVVWSCGIVYFTAALFAVILLRPVQPATISLLEIGSRIPFDRRRIAARAPQRQ
jgi:membrane-associated PAP2 superfamily phosphatase